MGLASAQEPVRLVPLSGGVSSDIWRADLAGRTVCVKRARPRLKVAALWEAPVERNHYEAEYMRLAAELAPGLTPRLLAEDESRGLLVMEFLDPADWRVWKEELRDGRVDLDAAVAVARGVAALHAGTADRADVAARFPTDAFFQDLRLDPYLAEAGRRHVDLAPQLEAVIAVTAATRRVLVHGDVSPKNVLVGAGGVRLLDAECAWFGDPAFDLAFCLNHLILKAVWKPVHADHYRAAFAAFLDGYAAGVTWEGEAALRARTAVLLPGLFLARVDGKSPVEYLTDEPDRALVRRLARRFLRDPPQDPAPLADAVRAEVAP
jgi:aminoglycoside phosphotransferase (APT) family kinase protein